MVRRQFTCAVLCVAALSAPAAAQAQAFRSGDTFNLGGTTFPVEQPDVAYDSTNNRYLQVAGKSFIEAHLLNASGGLIRTFNVTTGEFYGQNPRVAFSPDIAGGGGYLVTWHASVGDIGRVRGRIFTAAGDPVTGEFDIATSATSVLLSTQWTMGAPAAYATGSKEFLVVFGGNKYTTYDVIGQRVSNAGALLGGNFMISGGGSDLYDRDPSVAYNPVNDKFVVGWGVYHEAGRFGYSSSRSVQAGSGALGTMLNHGSAVGVSITSIAYNRTANQFLFAWHNQTSSSQFHYGLLLDADGNPASDLRVMSAHYAAYDALDIEFNSLAGEYFLITHGHNHEDAGVTIKGDGHAYDNGFLVTSTTDVTGNFHPRLATSTNAKQWLVVTASMFARTVGQFVASNSTGSNQPQPESCTISFSTSGESFGVFGGSGGFTLTTGSSCAWTAASSVPWITLSSSSQSGTGSKTVSYSVAANPSKSARSGTLSSGNKSIAVTQAGRTWKVTDFNQDGRNDLIWQNKETGALSVWKMDGLNLMSGEYLSPAVVADTAWKIVGSLDANLDGHADILWQHDTGYVSIWLMNQQTLAQAVEVTESVTGDPRWRIAGAGDIDRDGYDDVLWQHSNGTVAVWYMNGAQMRESAVITAMADPQWRVVGVEDFDRDGRLDLLWRHAVTGQVAIWRMDNQTRLEGVAIDFIVSDIDWQIEATSDLNGDAKPDLIWRNTRTGYLAAWLMDGLQFDVRNGVWLNPGQIADVKWRIVGPR